MTSTPTRTILAHLALAVGTVALLASGADHLDEYAASGFSSVPTIGTLFLLNFISATLVGLGLLLPLGRFVRRFAAPLRALLALSGIAIAGSSLIGLWISKNSSPFGFTDRRPSADDRRGHRRRVAHDRRVDRVSRARTRSPV